MIHLGHGLVLRWWLLRPLYLMLSAANVYLAESDFVLPLAQNIADQLLSDAGNRMLVVLPSKEMKYEKPINASRRVGLGHSAG